MVYIDYCEHGYILRFSLSLSRSLASSCFIPHWLTCFTSTAVISTAFTELINGAKGWVGSCSTETTPSLCLLHTWITTWRKGGSCVRQGIGVEETEGWMYFFSFRHLGVIIKIVNFALSLSNKLSTHTHCYNYIILYYNILYSILLLLLLLHYLKC